MTDHALCFAILAERARHRSTLAYSELGALVGVHHRSCRLHSALGSIWQWCHEHRHPHINAIVVYKSGPRVALPGGPGYTPNGQAPTRAQSRIARDTIFDYEWSLVDEPAEWPEGHCGEGA